MRIKAAVLERPHTPFAVCDLDIAEPRPDEVLVEVHGAGICHTDIGVRDAHFPVPMPVVLGHEAAGTVEAVGANVSSLVRGDHVVLTVNTCGGCRTCRIGRPTYCEHLYERNFSGARPDGSSPLSRNGAAVHGAFFNQSSFATYAIASERNAIRVPKNAPLEMLGPLGCGVQTGAGTVMNALRAPAGASIAIFGAGAVGLSALLAAKLQGCAPVIVVDTRKERLRLALKLGADHVIDADESDPKAVIVALTRGGVDFAVEATGVPKVLRTAVESMHPLGVCALVGAAPFGSEVALDVSSIFFGRTVRGVLEGDAVPHLFIPRLVELYAAGKFPFNELVKFYAFDQINEAVRDATELGITIKPILLTL